MVERVIVAVDGGAASDAALAWVLNRARTVEMSVEMTTVVGLDSELPGGAETGYRTSFEAALARAEAQARASNPELAVTTKIRHGIPHEALIDASRDADLLVIGTNRTSAVAGMMHGTLPLKIAGQAECPTVIVPAAWKPRPGKVVAGWTNDATAEEALDFAAREAEHGHGQLAIVHTWSSPPAAPVDGDSSAMLVERFISANRQLLAGAAHRVERAHPSVRVTQEMHAGSAAVAIIGAATDASLVVVGSRGRGAIADLLLGSVSHDVLLNMPAPVVVVPKRATAAYADSGVAENHR
jgi:nucleotide-binding universal stress UspA family protein